jgi:hypothetical protein
MPTFGNQFYPVTGGGGGGGGLTSIPTGQTVWVDATSGTGAGLRGRQDRAFDTVAGALGVALAGDVVKVRPGVYAEWGLTVPASVRLLGDGWQVVTIGSSSAASDVLTLLDGSALIGVTVAAPAGAGLAGVAHAAGTATIQGCNVVGDGATGSGWGVSKTGTGKLIGGDLRCESGGLDALLRVSGGVLSLDDTHLPPSAGSIGAMLHTDGSGTFQGQGYNTANTNTTDAVRLDGSSTVRLYSPNISGVTNAVHIVADGPTFESTGGRFGGVALSVLVDPALTGTGTTVRTLATQLEPLFSFPPVAAVNTDFVVSFTQPETNVRDARQRIIGQDLALGFPELGSGIYVGRGAPYADGIKVLTTDAVGGNLTDETTAAISRSLSTFSFQGTAPGHSILVASLRRDAGSVPFKHYGALVQQAAAGVGGSYAFDVWDGAAWAEVGIMAVSESEGYRYGDKVFLRSGSLEHLYPGVTSATTWALSTIDGTGAYWFRVRIVTAATTLPTFERWQVLDSTAELNAQGQRAASGLAQWRSTLFAGGNVFAGGGTTTNGSTTVGTGGGTWVHELDGSKLNSNGDTVSTQFAIPYRLCTAHQVTISVLFDYSQYNSAPTIEGRLLGVQRVGALVADPGGAAVPVPRTEAATDAVTATAGSIQSRVLATSTIGKIQSETFGPYPVADLVAGDLILFQLQLTADGGGGGGATDLQVWGIEVNGLAFRDGDRV